MTFGWLLLHTVCWGQLAHICLPYFLCRDPKLYLHFHWISCCAYCTYFCRLFIRGMYFFCDSQVSDNHMFYRFGLLIVLCAFFFFFSHLVWRSNSIVKKRKQNKNKKWLYKCIYNIKGGLSIFASFLRGAGEDGIRGASVGEMRALQVLSNVSFFILFFMMMIYLNLFIYQFSLKHSRMNIKIVWLVLSK